MPKVFTLLFILTLMGSAIQLLYDFNASSDIKDWNIVNDTVMGGRSNSDISLTSDGHALFEGHVSLANNGGFCSIQYDVAPTAVKDNKHVVIRLKGDGKDYQFRIKGDRDTYYSYIATFATSGQWEEISIPLASMEPSFRGRKLDLPNFNGDQIEQIVFLIGNKKEQDFTLLIDRLELRP
ncbi:CIA30 family protein [Croceiramulus getboli]|nr:CIA30 family protein [Flavobacteriaceae bacterium YJPT1-3]